jgi:hypothetical protein
VEGPRLAVLHAQAMKEGKGPQEDMLEAGAAMPDTQPAGVGLEDAKILPHGAGDHMTRGLDSNRVSPVNWGALLTH